MIQSTWTTPIDFISKKQNDKLNLSHELIYDSTGPIPFPKGGTDIDDNHQKIQSILDKYGIKCPGAESVTVEQDHADPFLKIITIKKTVF